MSSRFKAVLFASVICMAGAANADGASYTYDALGRLIQVVITKGGITTTIVYAYDEAGNRITVSVTP